MSEYHHMCMWSRCKILKIVEILSKTYIDYSEFVIRDALDDGYLGRPSNYFEFLTAVILSQNTSDRNAIKAFSNLKKVLGEITPESILRAGDDVVKSAIRISGLVNRKSRVLKQIALFLRDNPFYLKDLEKMDVEKARERLLELPGVGLKTADVFLLMVLKKPTFPIDTHINRIVRRLGIASASDRYEDVRMTITRYLDSNINALTMLHLLLIVHGRRVCTARRPKCSQCTIFELCCRNI
ncbi:MAG: endonuclease III [Ignisphaera sp.]|nr:endonuclease III [Ignisphaera sp.]MCX8167564.1 endonuclease III [Ignisphaera sp.]MDW8086031.1 endonuclease III [Ignisphaera sp.]